MQRRYLIHINAGKPAPTEHSVSSGLVPFGEETGQS